MPPFWVVKRELLRTLDHAKFPLLAAIAPIRRRLHDATKAQSSRVTQGQQLRGPRVAVYLLYQPNGLLPSTIQTCRHLTDKGFTTLIVSNAALSEHDRALLSPFCFTMLERLNFGYDFGGYRDGILHLLDTATPVDRLFVLNDSVWFPTVANEDFLDQVLIQDADLYGAVQAQAKRHLEDRYVQSYAFAFKGAVVHSAAFATYWRGLNIQSNREWAVRTCERKMTAFFRAHGFTVGARWDCETIAETVSKLSDEEIAALLQLEAVLENKSVVNASSLTRLKNQMGWRKEAEAYIRSPAFRKFILLLHPATLAKLNFPFLKKSYERRFSLMRLVYADEFKYLCDPIMMAEIAKWDRKEQDVSLTVVSQTAGKAA